MCKRYEALKSDHGELDSNMTAEKIGEDSITTLGI
jgi:hypothetical protein